MKKYLLGGWGNFYKANLHTHSTVSDGKLTPEEIKREYMKKGYSIIAYTDHDNIVSHNDLSDGNFLAITSFELGVNNKRDVGKTGDFMHTYHINFYSKDKNASGLPVNKDGLDYSIDCINAVIKGLNEKGFLACYNHPVWSLQNYKDYGGLKGLWGVEVHNTVCACVGLPENDQAFADLLGNGVPVVPIAGDDMHDLSAAFGGFSVIQAENLDYDSVFSAMEKGNIYSSNGPKIKEISIENGILTVKCDPVKAIYYNSERRWAGRVAGDNITEAKFDLNYYLEMTEKFSPDAAFARITIVDENGKKAWSRAYKAEELK